jgi:DNA-binding NtrC family response regulator
MNGPLALVVVADPSRRTVIGRALEHDGLTVIAVGREIEAADLLRDRPFDLVLVDLTNAAPTVADLLRLRAEPDPPPAFIGLAPTLEAPAAVEWAAAGAVEILVPPFDDGQLREATRKGLHQRVGRLGDELRGRNGLIGRSAELATLREQLERLADLDSSVWFAGEAGTGRETAARTLHTLSSRRGGPFVALRARSQPALERLKERAAGGALFLEEPAAMSLDQQSRLCAMLAPPREFRVCCSSLGPPAAAIDRGRLLPELGALVAEETVEVPPLRARAEDIPLLARHFVRGICAMNSLRPVPIAADALALLADHAWPENVRELRNILEQAVIVSRDGTIQVRDLPESIRRRERSRIPPSPAVSPAAGGPRRFREAKREVVDRFESGYLGELMMHHGGNVTAAAQHAGMLRSALQRLLRKHGIRSAEFRAPARHPVT